MTTLAEWFEQAKPTEADETPEAPEGQTKDKPEETNRFKDWDVPEFDQLGELVQAQPGETISEKIKHFQTVYQDKISKFDEFSEKEKEREDWYRLNKITESREFQEQYETPLRKRLDFYSSLMSEVGDDGKPKRDDHYRKLRESIWNEGGDMTAAKIKALFKSFSSQYTEKFGAAPDLPSIKEVLDAREELANALESKNKAMAEWEQMSAAKQQEAANQYREQQENNLKTIIAEQKNKFKSWAEAVDVTPFTSFAKPDQVKSVVNDLETEFSELLASPQKQDTSMFFERSLKAKLFDELLGKFKEFKDYVESRNLSLPTQQGGDKDTPSKRDEVKLSEFFGMNV